MNKFFKTIRYLSIMIFVVIISAVITYIINPNFSDTLNSISRNISKSASQKSGLSLVIAYIFNNGFRVPISMLILSIISIQFLYWINHFLQPYYLEFYLEVKNEFNLIMS